MSNLEHMPEADAEKSVIGAIIMDPDSIVEAIERVKADHFADPFLGKAFEIAKDMLNRGVPANLVTLSSALVDAGYKNAPVDMLAISQWVVGNNIYPANVSVYADMVVRYSRIRDFMSAAPKKIAELMQHPELDPADILSGWLGEVETGQRRDDPGPRSFADMMADVSATMDGRRAGTVVNDQTEFPWKSLNDLIGGIKPGEVCVLAGRAGSGKTVAGVQILGEASMSGTAVMFSAEMTYDSVIERMLASETGIPYAKIVKPTLLNEEEYDLVQSYMDGLSSLPIYIDDLSGITTDQIMARTQTLQREGTISMLVFDYLELAGDDSGGTNQEARVSGIIRNLKHIARRLHIPVLVLSQLSREVERRNPPIPRLSDLRMSGMVEQVADKVIMLYRPQYYVQQGMLEPDASIENLIEFYVHKNRNGQSGKVQLHFEGPVFRISEIPDSGYQYQQGGF